MKARYAVGVAAVVAGAMALGLIVASRRPYLGRRTLPDGTTLTLLAVNAGNKHPSPMATPWEKLAPLLPPGWRARLKVGVPQQTYSRRSSNYMTVWFTEELKAGYNPQRFRVLV